MQTETQKTNSATITARDSDSDLPVASALKTAVQPASVRRIRPIVPNVFRAPN